MYSTNESNMDLIDDYFTGRLLYGDDFDAEQVQGWFEDEKEGYANLGAKIEASYEYGYHALNRFHGFSHLPPRDNLNILGFGSAYGEELRPLLKFARAISIVDPSSAFIGRRFEGVPVSYVQPQFDGRLPFQTGSFDLLTCFGVLHHIPNVTDVVHELGRVVRTDGYFLLREPVISMGDWRKPRAGLTKRERGIPLPLLVSIVEKAGFTIERKALCAFPLTTRVFGRGGRSAYNIYSAVACDALLSAMFAWNLRYHATSVLQKIRPSSVFLVLRKI